MLSWATRGVATGNLDPRRGQIIERTCTAFIRGVEKRDLGNRVRELEARMKRLKKEA